MDMHAFPVIDLVATGDNIRRLRLERGLSVRDLQKFFGFEQPQAIYKWQKGACLPTVDNLYALGSLFGISTRSAASSACRWIRSWSPSRQTFNHTSSSRNLPAALHFMGIRQRLKPRAPFSAAGCRGGGPHEWFFKFKKIKKHKMETCVRGWGKGGRGICVLTHWRQGDARDGEGESFPFIRSSFGA